MLDRTPMHPDQCPQCWQHRDPESFIGARGARVRWCAICRERYRGWTRKTTAEKLALPRRGVTSAGPLRARLFLRSGNHKLGGLPSSITSRGTCPPSCGFYAAGCYALYHVLASHWRRVGARGDTWPAFLREVAALPPGQLWRHNEAGDLPGKGEAIDVWKLAALVMANHGRRGFTYTHKHQGAQNRLAIKAANAQGFTVNMSADTVDQADELARSGVGPVVVVLPADAPDKLRTPQGRRVIVCPAQTRAALTCSSCALCAVAHRKAIVGFRAHGQMAAQVPELVQLRRSARDQAQAVAS